METQTAAQGRACGACRACCLVYYVDEIKDDTGNVQAKKGWTWCVHCVEGVGCAIHRALAERAPKCYQFSCLWLEGVMPESFRPDEIGVAFDTMCDLGTGDTLLRATEVWPGALGEPEIIDLIQRVVRSGMPVYYVEFERNPIIYLRDGLDPAPIVLRMREKGVPLLILADS